MSDRDPRPMPPEVLRAYRDPVDLRGLLMSSVYSESDRRDVLDALVRSLIAKYGDVWVVDRGEDVSVGSLVRGRRLVQDIPGAIDLLLSVWEYEGSRGVLPPLAQLMQRRWTEWWDGFEWEALSDVGAWHDIAACVIGPRQFTWLAAQYARSVIDVAKRRNREVALRAIEAAEVWARVPSESNRKAAEAAVDAAQGDPYVDVAGEVATYAASAAARVDSFVAARAASSAAVAASMFADTYDEFDDNLAEAYGRLAALTKSLITPTLVTSASGAVHSTKRW